MTDAERQELIAVMETTARTLAQASGALGLSGRDFEWNLAQDCWALADRNRRLAAALKAESAP